jgi:predicted aspartyl protease
MTMLMAGAIALTPALHAQGHGPAPAPVPAARAPAAPTPARPVSPLDAIFDAAGRGEMAPLQRALADRTTRPEVRVLLDAGLAASRYDPAAGRDPALRRMAEGGDPALRRVALRILTGTTFAQGDYEAAARYGRILAEALAMAGEAEEASATDQVWRLAALLAPHGQPRVEGPVRAATVPARADRVGLTRIDFKVNGTAQDAVVDTGANLSVLSAATARRMGVTILEGETPVSNGVEGTVATRIGVAARIEIAGTVLVNVPFLIIDDANLTFPQVPGGYDIRAIIGLPELRALGRVRLERAGRFTVLPPVERGRPAPANMHASANDLFVDLEVEGRPLPLHFDTGANQTQLSALYAASQPARLAALQTQNSHMSSAGGTRQSRTALWPEAPLALAGRGFAMPLQVMLPGDGPPPRFNGVLGADVLRRFESYTIDFARMRLSLGAPVPPAAPRPAAPAGH